MTGSNRPSFNRRRPQKVRFIGRARVSGVTRRRPAGVDLNPLKDFDLTEGWTVRFPSARLGNPSVQFGFPSDWLGFPSAQLGIPSVRPGTLPFGLAERPHLGSLLVPAGGGRLGSYKVSENGA